MDEQDNLQSREQLEQITFIQYVIILANAGMQQLGKMMNPLTAKMERNLEAAKATIDLLSLLKIKTKGNLTSDEEDLLSSVLANLQLNYADEISSKQSQDSQQQDAQQGVKP